MIWLTCIFKQLHCIRCCIAWQRSSVYFIVTGTFWIMYQRYLLSFRYTLLFLANTQKSDDKSTTKQNSSTASTKWRSLDTGFFHVAKVPIVGKCTHSGTRHAAQRKRTAHAPPHIRPSCTSSLDNNTSIYEHKIYLHYFERSFFPCFLLEKFVFQR